MNTIIYGAGITSQIRQQFIIEYGCTGYTPAILHHLVTHYAHRGIIEIGAGHGQWAKALHDYYQKMKDITTTTTATTNEEKKTNSDSDDGQLWMRPRTLSTLTIMVIYHVVRSEHHYQERGG
jgi:hypothetical protein